MIYEDFLIYVFFILNLFHKSLTSSINECTHNSVGKGNLWTHENLCLRIVSNHRNWYDARNGCAKRGGDLLQIRESSLQASVTVELQKLNLKDTKFWIGATDSEHEGHWQWVSGDRSMHYTNWNPGQGPNQGGFIFSGGLLEDCGLLDSHDNYRWHDYPCSGGPAFHYSYICQYEMVRKSSLASTLEVSSSYSPSSTDLSTDVILVHSSRNRVDLQSSSTISSSIQSSVKSSTVTESSTSGRIVTETSFLPPEGDKVSTSILSTYLPRSRKPISTHDKPRHNTTSTPFVSDLNSRMTEERRVSERLEPTTSQSRSPDVSQKNPAFEGMTKERTEKAQYSNAVIKSTNSKKTHLNVSTTTSKFSSQAMSRLTSTKSSIEFSKWKSHGTQRHIEPIHVSTDSVTITAVPELKSEPTSKISYPKSSTSSSSAEQENHGETKPLRDNVVSETQKAAYYPSTSKTKSTGSGALVFTKNAAGGKSHTLKTDSTRTTFRNIIFTYPTKFKTDEAPHEDHSQSQSITSSKKTPEQASITVRTETNIPEDARQSPLTSNKSRSNTTEIMVIVVGSCVGVLVVTLGVFIVVRRRCRNKDRARFQYYRNGRENPMYDIHGDRQTDGGRESHCVTINDVYSSTQFCGQIYPESQS